MTAKKKASKKKATIRKPVAKKKTAKKKAATKKTQTAQSLTKQQRIELHAQARVEGKNISDAFRISHPHCVANNWKAPTIHTHASEFDALGEVQVRIAELSSNQLDKHEASISRVIEELTKIAFFNPKHLFDENGKPIPIHKLPDEVAAVITAFDFGALTKGKDQTQEQYLKSLKIIEKSKGLNMLGQWFEMFSKNHVPTPPPTPAGPTVNFNVDVSGKDPKHAIEVFRLFKNECTSV